MRFGAQNILIVATTLLCFVNAVFSGQNANPFVKKEPLITADSMQEQRELAIMEKLPLRFSFGDNIFEFITKMRVETFFGKGTHLLDDDKTFIPARHTLDFNWLYSYGRKSCGYNVAQFRATIRTKGVWGNNGSIASTTETAIKSLDSSLGGHTHALPRYFLWVREAWLEFSLGDMMHLPLERKHFFRLGLFPFELGRGISLGASYAVDPDFLGHYSPVAVDQFAPGFLFSGSVIDAVGYDLYLAITQNFSDSFNNVNAHVLGQLINRRCDPARGFGKINYIAATRLRLKPFDEPCKRMYIEPYALFNDEREQRIEVQGDASAKLGTVGLAFEAAYGDFECGFDMAMNVGRQLVYALDRNVASLESREGTIVQVNSQIKAGADAVAPDVPGKKALFREANQEAIDASPQDSLYNGQPINGFLTNEKRRFRPYHENRLHGTMAVFDMAYNFRCFSDMKWAFAAGWASGDDHPHRDFVKPGDCHRDKSFGGFIGLQETYNGTRVRSAFVLSGSGSLPRVGSFPAVDVPDRFASSTSRFTNLIFTGSALNFKGAWGCRTWSLNPNVLLYWQAHRTHRFDLVKKVGNPIPLARRYLGFEVNVFMDAMLLNDLKMFCVSSIFVPGSHYDDIKGLPLNKDQQKFIDGLAKNGVAVHRPLLGNNMAFFINVGLEYKF